MKIIELGKVESRCGRRTLAELEAKDFDRVGDGLDLNGAKMRFAFYTCTCCKTECRVPWDLLPIPMQEEVTARLGKGK